MRPGRLELATRAYAPIISSHDWAELGLMAINGR